MPANATLSTAPRPVPASGVERRLRNMIVLFGVAVLVVAWVTVAAILNLKRQDAITAEVRQNTNLVRAFEEQTVRVLAAADQATVRLRDLVAAGKISGPDLVRVANETGLVPDILVQLSWIDGTGHFVGSNLDPEGSKTGHVDLTSREHVKVHLAPDQVAAPMRLKAPDDLFISKPVLGKVSKKWTIQLSRRITDAQGQLRGVIVASLDPGYFEGVYRRVTMGQLGGLTLLGSDLTIRARVIGGQSVGMGSSVPADSGFATHAVGHAEGDYTTVSSIDGIARMLSFRQVAKYPLVLLASTSEVEALAEWRTTRNIAVTLTGVLSLAIALGTWLFIGSLRRLERSNEALRRSEAQANSANQAKTEFLAAISHELRTPLTSIRGFAELMEERLENERFRKQAGLIRKGAEHLNTLLTQILDLAKVEAGAMPLAPEPVNVRQLVQGTADFFALTAASKQLGLTVEFDEAVPETMDCDGLRLKQILNNLLSNALKFTLEGGVRLRVRLDDSGQRVLFDVIDTGPGIPADKQALVFEKFRQANDRISFEHGGTGLGLALSRGLAELMHGHLTLVSVEGQGASFTLSLPR